MPRQPEAKIVARIQRAIRERGGTSFKIHGGDNPFQSVGIPDLLVSYRGRFVGLEVKQPGNSPSPVQKAVLHEIVESGAYASVVSTVEEVVHLLAKIDLEVGRETNSSRIRHRSILDRSLKRYR